MAYSEPLSASDDAWSAFLRARFNAQRSSATLDYELQILLDPKTAVMARQLRNESVSACRLPPEVLATMFSFAQNDWQYERLSQERQQFSIGWKSITRVCCVWRKVALETASLWRDISCYAVPIQEAPYILARTGVSPLSLQFYGHALSPGVHGIVAAHLESWMSPPICLRLTSLTIYEPVGYFRLKRWPQWLQTAMPRLESLHIELLQSEFGDQVAEQGDDDRLNSTSLAQLRKLHLNNCLLRWPSSFVAASVTVLCLTHDRPPLSNLLPSTAEFLQAIAGLPSLQHLELMNLFPRVAEGLPIAEIHLPLCFEVLLVKSTTSLATRRCLALLHYLRLPYRGRRKLMLCGTHIPMDDFATLIAETFRGEEDTIVPTSLTRAVYLDSREFKWIVFPGISSTSRWLEELEEDGLGWDGFFFKNERVLTLDSAPSSLMAYLHSVPLTDVSELSISKKAARFFTSVDAWLTAFATAREVIFLVLDYAPAMYHLFCALAMAANDSPENPGLFPLLKAIAFYNTSLKQLSENELAKLHVALSSFLHLRKNMQARVPKIYVREQTFQADMWREVEKVTDVAVMHIRAEGTA